MPVARWQWLTLNLVCMPRPEAHFHVSSPLVGQKKKEERGKEQGKKNVETASKEEPTWSRRQLARPKGRRTRDERQRQFQTNCKRACQLRASVFSSSTALRFSCRRRWSRSRKWSVHQCPGISYNKGKRNMSWLSNRFAFLWQWRSFLWPYLKSARLHVQLTSVAALRAAMFTPCHLTRWQSLMNEIKRHNWDTQSLFVIGLIDFRIQRHEISKLILRSCSFKVAYWNI